MWGGRFAAPPSALLRALNDSFAFDRELFAEDVAGSIAWAHALARAGVLTDAEADAIVNGLGNVPAPRDVEGGQADAPVPPNETHVETHEDIHSYVEAKLYEAVGPLAGKLHTGRSRNDQVATDLKLWLRRACDD